MHLVLWNRISHWLETWLVCLAVDSQIPSVSGCPAWDIEVCTTMPATFMLVLGIKHRESFMLARQAAYCQSHTHDLGVSFPCWTIFCLAPTWVMVYWDPAYFLEYIWFTLKTLNRKKCENSEKILVYLIFQKVSKWLLPMQSQIIPPLF